MNDHPRNIIAARDANPWNDRITEADITEACQIFFACLLVDNSIAASSGLESEDFDVDLYRTIFDATIKLSAQGLDANPVSLKPFIPKGIRGLQGSPAEYLIDLAVSGTVPFIREQLDQKIQIIKNAALARATKADGEFRVALASEGHSLITLGLEIEKAEARFRETRERLTGAKQASDDDVIDSYLRMITGENEGDGSDGIPLPFRDFEHLINDTMLRSGRTYGILGASAEGKTSLTLQIVYGALMAGHPVCILSYDQDQMEILAQITAQQEGIPFSSQMQNSRNHQRLSQHQIDKAYTFIRKLKRLPFEVIQCRTSDTVQKLEPKMDGFLRRRANGRMPLFVFDHIRAIKPSVQGDEGTKALQIGQDIHDAMKARKSAGWVLQQRSTTGLRRENPRPASADLFGGDSAKQPFDVIFYVFRASEHRDEQVRTAKDEAEAGKVKARFAHIYGKSRDDEYFEIDGYIEIGMIKNRFGPKNRKAIMAFDAEYTRFSSRHQPIQQELLP